MTSPAHAILHNRVLEVIEETAQLLNAEVKAGRITSDAATDKVQHLVKVVRKYMAVADAPASFTDYEATPSSAHVEVMNVLNVPIQAPTQEVSVDLRPALQFVRFSGGIVNLQHIVLLDVASRRLYVAGGLVVGLNDADVTALKYYLKLYAVTN